MNCLEHIRVSASSLYSFNLLNARADWLQSQGKSKRRGLSAITLGKSTQVFGVPYQLVPE